jgi:ATP-dependent Clp protease protease subunit
MKLSRYTITAGSFGLGFALFFAPPSPQANAQAAATAPETKDEVVEKEEPTPAVPAVPAVKEAPPAPEPPKKTQQDIIREEISKISLERELLSAQATLSKEKLAADLRVRREMLDREKLDMEERSLRLQREVLDRKEKLERGHEKLREQTDRLKIEKDAAAAKVDLTLNQLRLKEVELKGQLSHRSLIVANKDKEIQSRLYAERAPVYLDNPLKGKTLVISDRRIPLNGPISARTASEISTRIQYYNNKDSKKPIFIVIDDSPGGSVMAGYHILKAMEGSDAPVYVVLKQFAASMAACITTLADRSFAYPNAVMLHHQISSGVRGNLTQQRESLEEVEEWWRRLAEPVAKKMGIGTEEFIKQMYDKVSTGDWTEFADEAQRLKWVDVIVEEIRETGQEKHPDARKPTVVKATLTPPTRSFELAPGEASPSAQRTDANGRPYVLLPRPNPIDKYYLYNPDSYYRFP